VRPADRAAVRALLDRGVHVTLCTGRMFTGTQPLALDLGLDAPVACVDGSHVAHAVSGAALACAGLTTEAITIFCEVLRRHDAAPFALSDELLFHDEDGHAHLDYMRLWSRQTLVVRDMLVTDSWHRGRTVPAMLALGTEERIRAAAEALGGRAQSLLQTIVFESQSEFDDGTRPWAVLVRAAGIDKGTGIEWLARHYGISLDEVVAVGDWLNDVPMLERAGLSFAMAQAPEDVQSVADAVLDSDHVTGGAIAEVARRAGLL
jgi:hydroxymethylpyrimidine pyrophosphatase-like HAD family hydrolase